MNFVITLFASLYSIKAQLYGATTIPNGCGYFQYPNSTLDPTNLPSAINQALLQIDNYLEYIYNTQSLPSISFGIVYEQTLLYYTSYGYTNLSTNIKPNQNTIYRIGSVTKVFTVLLAYILRDKGIIHLDDYISKYNPNFEIKNMWGVTKNEKLGKTITTKQLSSQLSGLPRQPPCLFGNIIADKNDLLCINATTNQILNLLKNESIQHPLNLHPSYSNTAYAVLGNILAEYLNMTYEQAVFEYIFKPLNMSHSGLYLTAQQAKYAATGYTLKSNGNHESTEWEDWGWVSPAAQIFSSIDNLATLMKQIFASYPSIYSINNDAFENFNYLMSPQLFRDWLLPIYINPDLQSAFGAPWEIQELNGQILRTKGGDVTGFSSHIDIIPDMRVGVIALVNQQIDVSIITYPVMEILIPVIQSYLIQQTSVYKPVLPSEKILNVLVGEYYFVYDEIKIGPPFTVTIVEMNGNKWLNAYDAMFGVFGTLIWDQIMGNSIVNLFWHQINDNTKSCWLNTLGGSDGVNMQFVLNGNDEVEYVLIPDYFYGFKFQEKNRIDEKVFVNKTIFKGVFGL